MERRRIRFVPLPGRFSYKEISLEKVWRETPAKGSESLSAPGPGSRASADGLAGPFHTDQACSPRTISSLSLSQYMVRPSR